MLDSGGGNGMSCFPTGVHFDIPVIDGDAMGRAYPTMYHGKIHGQNSSTYAYLFAATFSVYGHSLTPCVLSDAHNNTSVIMVGLSASLVGINVNSPPQIENGYSTKTGKATTIDGHRTRTGLRSLRQSVIRRCG